MILHATYNNGLITIKEKNIPKIKRDIIIDIPTEDTELANIVDFKDSPAFGIWKDRKDMQDSNRSFTRS